MTVDTRKRGQTAWRSLLVLLLALILARFGVVGMPKILANHISSDGDESAYLSLGLALPEEGILSDGTRPPLYALLLSPWAERTWAYFTTAKLATLAVGGLTVLAVFMAGVRLFSWETALLAAFLLAANKEFHVRASTVYADTLLALIMLGSWYYLIRSVQRGALRDCILAGVFVGLSFLTKGSAPVLLAAWGLTALLVHGKKIYRQGRLLLAPLVFIIVSLPLLIYNAQVFGSPTYNFATQHIMWMDQLAQINTADPADLPTLSTYIATHSPADMVERAAKGVRRLNPVVTRSLIPGRDFEPAWLGSALGLLALAALLFLLIFRRDALRRYLVKNQAVLWFTFFLNGLFYIFFTWYVAGSSAETRFIVPLLGPIYLVLADMIVSVGRGLGQRLSSGKGRPGLQSLYRLALALLLGWGVWWLVDTSRREAWAMGVDPYEADRKANAEEEEIVQWLARDRPAGEALILFGPSKSLPLWKFPARFSVERLPVEINTWPDMQAYVQAREPDYIIIDHDTARRRRAALAGYFERGDQALVWFEQIPPGWSLDLLYPGLPCRWCIFSPAQDGPPLATLAEEIDLLDYRVVGAVRGETGALGPDEPVLAAGSGSAGSPIVIPGGQDSLRVILTWRTRTALPADYTAFVHLSAPDGFVKAQRDRPPFGGAYPTSRWQPGDVLADRYEFLLDESIIPGDYVLLAGMYLPATGDRLPVTAGPAGPVPAVIRLGSIRIEAEP